MTNSSVCPVTALTLGSILIVVTMVMAYLFDGQGLQSLIVLIALFLAATALLPDSRATLRGRISIGTAGTAAAFSCHFLIKLFLSLTN